MLRMMNKKSDYGIVYDTVVYFTNDKYYDFEKDDNFDYDVSHLDDLVSDYSIMHYYFNSYVDN